MIVALTIIRYPKKYIAFAFLAMAIHRLPLSLTKKCTFWKLLGCGKNGTFDINPDYQQWGLLTVWDEEKNFRTFQQTSFISKWWKTFCNETYTILLEPIEAHGKWSGKEPFGQPKIKNHTGRVAVLTRATIRLSKLKNFWSNVPRAAAIMAKSKGFVTSVGIGEAPFVMQATISVWDSIEDVKNFAYKSKDHAEIVKLTRAENWYSEDLFARFKVLKSEGTLMGIDPLSN
jgi:heme-degrading monooxygenase HmoA